MAVISKQKTATRVFYSFNSAEYSNIQDEETRDAVGVRGKRLLELAQVGAPILPGFLIAHSVIDEICAEKDGHSSARKLFTPPIAKIEQIMEKRFGDPENPLLVKVVESPMLQMVSGAVTIHNIGLCETTVAGFAKFVGEEFAWHEYRNVFIKIIELERKGGISADRLSALDGFLKKLRAAKDQNSTRTALEAHRSLYPEAVFTDAYAQMWFVVDLYRSYFSNSTTSSDSSLLVQAMAFGNYGEESFYGDYYTRNIISGESQISGTFFKNSFDAGDSVGMPIGEIDPAIARRLEEIAASLEGRFKEIRNVRFTVESGRLWLIDQRPVPNKSTQAEIRMILDLYRKGLVDASYVVQSVKPGRLSEILHPVLDIETAEKLPKVKGGIAGAVGAAVGRVYFSTERLMKAHKFAVQSGEPADFILAMPATFAEDVKAIEVARGVITCEGGYASHAPVVARSLGKVAMVHPEMVFKDSSFKLGNKTVKEGDFIALNVPYYDEPAVYFGKVPLIVPSPEGSGLLELLEIVQGFIDDFDVHANADQPKDALLAKKFGATGIGLCRTEHMFFNENRINIFRSMIIAEDNEERMKALRQLEEMQCSDFYEILKIMAGYPVTIRLLDAPFHEFLPHTKEGMEEFVAFFKTSHPDLTDDEIRARCDLLKEFNPMLGHRGVRIAISYPEIYNMQVRAILRAACRLKQEKVDARPEIMIPVVMTASELKAIRFGKRIEGKFITGIKDIEQEVLEEFGMKEPIHCPVGTMIELPAAALQADKIARYADFFSFGTNDLTQTTNGLSRDDFNSFFSDYNEFDLLGENPFKVLGDQVKELIKIAADRGRLTRHDLVMGLCGEHGAEGANIPFIKEAGLNYVSCSPYGIPIAKLTIAQMNIKNKVQN